MNATTNRKPLNQSDFICKIIEDLGVIQQPNWKKPKRAVKLECINCKTHIIKDASNGKLTRHCDKCKAEESSRSRIKPLNQEDFKMRIIEDLGTTTVSNTSTNTNRMAIFECLTCKKHFKARASGNTAKQQTQCIDCASTNNSRCDHPLYHVWNGIKQRCYSAKRKDYHRYGGAGVTMQDSWIDNSAEFITWCENNGWKPGLHIDKDIKCRELGINPPTYSENTISFVTCSTNCREANSRKIDQFDLSGNYLNTFNSAIEAAESLGKTSGDTITNVCRGRAKTSYGYIWKYNN